MGAADKTSQQKMAATHYRKFAVSNKTKGESNAIFKLSDYQYTNESVTYNTQSNGTYDSTGMSNRTEVPKIIVLEYQPDLLFNWNQKWKKIKNQFVGSGKQLMAVGTELIQKSKDNIGLMFDGDSNPDAKAAREQQSSSSSALQSLFISDKEGEYRNQVLTTPINLYREFFDGKYIARYEIPLTDQSYMEADGYAGWNIADDNTVKTQFEVIAQIQQALQNFVPLDIPIVPEWKSKPKFISYTNTFTLYNNNFDNLKRNFLFLNAIIGGAQWMQVNYKQFSPNIYTVIVPGLVRLIYAKMRVKVKNVGNKRKLIETQRTSIKQAAKDVSLHADTMFPDAWEVKIEFESLVPNNYNTFINGLTESDAGSSVVINKSYITDEKTSTERQIELQRQKDIGGTKRN